MELQVLSFGVFDSRVKFPKVTVTDPRVVEEYELELFMDTQTGTSFVNGNAVPLSRGTLICAKPGQIRYSKLPIRCLYLHLQTQDPEVKQFLGELPDHFQLGDMETVPELFYKLMRLDVENKPRQRFLAVGYAIELIYAIRRQTYGGREDAPYAHRQAMSAVEQYIRRDLAGPMDLANLAQVANLSPSYFHKVFCGYFGVTPAEYVTARRISAAKAMLVMGEKSLDAIAEECGFGSQSYFNYRFRKITGTTPLQYRKEHLSRLLI